MATCYQIKDYDRRFVVSQARRMRDPSKATWVAVPIDFAERGYNLLLKKKDGPALFGAFLVIVQVAARCQKPGLLVSDDQPLTADDIALISRYPEKLIQETLNVCSGNDIRWIEKVEHSEHTPSTLREHSESTPTPLRREERRGEERTGEDGERERSGSGVPSLSGEESLFPEDGIPFLVSAEVQRLCPHLHATPAVISSGPFSISRLQHLPLGEWINATQELCAYLNSGGHLKQGKNWLTTLATYLQNRYDRWNDQGRPEGATSYPLKNNGAARDNANDSWARIADRQAVDSDLPDALRASRLRKRLGDAALPPPLPADGNPAA